MPVRVSYKKQFALGIMLLLTLLATVEVAAQIYDHVNPKCNLMTNEVSKEIDYFLKKQICDKWENQIMYLDPVTNLASLEPNQHSQTMNINSYGFRGPEISKEKPEESYRIFVVGGSTIFTVRALTDKHTIPGYLQENFDQLNLDKKIEVINAGIPAIASTDELQLIKTKIVNFEPDLIIIYDGYNDVNNPAGFTKANKIALDEFGNIYKKYFSFYKTPYLLESLTEEKNQKAPKRKGPFQEYNEGARAAVWKENMLAICEIGEKNGFETFVFLQPFLGTGIKTITEHEQKTLNKMNPKFFSEYQHFAAELKNIKEPCTGAFDLRNSFDKVSESIYFDKAHIGYDYNKMIADKIFEIISPTINYDKI